MLLPLTLSIIFAVVQCIGAQTVPVIVTRTARPEYVAGPTSALYDSPFTACNVSGIVNGYSANSITRLITRGENISAVLENPPEVGLGRGNKTDLDACGAWLNAVQYDAEAGIVRGFYHEEWDCDYARNFFTNKSIAYAESTDGGITFVKVNHPHNAIILPPPGNTTTAHQTGEGDHGVLKVNDTYMLYFREWDGPDGRVTTSVARATVASGGKPGSWFKFYNGEFSQPGLGGQSSVLTNLAGTAVYYRKDQQDFVAIETSDDGPRLRRSTDGINWPSNVSWPLFPAELSSWNRSGDPGELVAYVSLSGNGGGNDVRDSFYLYYTYLQPGTTFSSRYLVRRKVQMSLVSGDRAVQDASASASTTELAVYSSPNDTWTTTSIPLPNNSSYSFTTSAHYLLTQDLPGTRALIDCYIQDWQDHLVAFDKECSSSQGNMRRLRTLGFAYTSQPPTSTPSVPIYRCFDDQNKDHSISINSTECQRGKLEFLLGYVLL